MKRYHVGVHEIQERPDGEYVLYADVHGPGLPHEMSDDYCAFQGRDCSFIRELRRVVDENNVLREEVERLMSAAHHMEVCRALLKVPDDDVLYSAIEALKRQLADARKALIDARRQICALCSPFDVPDSVNAALAGNATLLAEAQHEIEEHIPCEGAGPFDEGDYCNDEDCPRCLIAKKIRAALAGEQKHADSLSYWPLYAFARLGVVRDLLPPEHVTIIQDFVQAAANALAGKGGVTPHA